MSANVSKPEGDQAAVPAVPKRITNAQTVCNEKNEKGKLCNGHLKQLRTAGEAAEIHLRGNDVLFKCQTCGTLYMGPPLGHVRDPNKQIRFVEAELAALLQAAGGTLPVIKKNAAGVYVIEEQAPPAAEAKPAAPKPAAAPAAAATPAASPKPAAAAPKPSAAKPAEHKAGAAPNKQLFRRSTYAGVVDTGPVPGESHEQKLERLRKLSAAVKQRSEEGGVPEAAPAAAAPAPAGAPPAVETASPAPPPAAAATTSSPIKHGSTGNPDRTLMKRYTYSGVVDTGPVPGESHEQKLERLRKLAAAVKERSEES